MKSLYSYLYMTSAHKFINWTHCIRIFGKRRQSFVVIAEQFTDQRVWVALICKPINLWHLYLWQVSDQIYTSYWTIWIHKHKFCFEAWIFNLLRNDHVTYRFLVQTCKHEFDFLYFQHQRWFRRSTVRHRWCMNWYVPQYLGLYVIGTVHILHFQLHNICVTIFCNIDFSLIAYILELQLNNWLILPSSCQGTRNIPL